MVLFLGYKNNNKKQPIKSAMLSQKLVWFEIGIHWNCLFSSFNSKQWGTNKWCSNIFGFDFHILFEEYLWPVSSLEVPGCLIRTQRGRTIKIISTLFFSRKCSKLMQNLIPTKKLPAFDAKQKWTRKNNSWPRNLTFKGPFLPIQLREGVKKPRSYYGKADPKGGGQPGWPPPGTPPPPFLGLSPKFYQFFSASLRLSD